jgi:hypothetical protein
VVAPAVLERFFAEAEDEAAVRARLIHDLSSVTVTAGTAVYPIALYELTSIGILVDGASTRTTLSLVSAEYLDGPSPLPWSKYPSVVTPDPFAQDWRESTGTPTLAIQTDTGVRLVPTPDAGGTLHLEGYRIPLGAVGRDPEINQIHHRHLIQWALYRVFSIPGMDQTDPVKAATALKEFERYFGPRPDADVRRSTRYDPPKHVQAFFP